MRYVCAGGLALAVLSGPTAGWGDEPALAAEVRAVLETHCHRCHGQNGSAKGGFGHVTELARLVERGQVVQGSPAESELLRRVESGEMPPGKGPRPTEAQIKLLRRWVEAGAPVGGKTTSLLSEGELRGKLLADLESLDARQRRFTRYLTLTHLVTAGDNSLSTARAALSKLVNSLSWHPRVTRPVPIDAGQTIYRIDLRAYRWTPALWDRLASAYPYSRASTPELTKLASATGSDRPYLRGDWFVAVASRPPFYYDFLALPAADRGLERLLQVDAVAGLRDETAVRAGFNDSGVSRNNRLIERHDAAFGAYWRSYDFDGKTGRRNLFEHPTGPGAGETSFAHAGGEMIFHLPNGLLGFLLADGAGRRVERAPVEIVSDPRRPDQRVEPGLSCMSCHSRGLLFKQDQLRAHVEKNATAFTPDTLAQVRALHAPPRRFRALIDEDNERYHKALARAGVVVADDDPVNHVTQRFEGTLDATAAASELGLPPADLAGRLKQSPSASRLLGALRAPGGTVQRQVFEQSFADVVRALHLDPPGTAAPTPPAAAFTGHRGPVLCVAYSPDGTRVASGGDDGTLRVWDGDAGRQLALMEVGGSVTAAAFTPDGRRLVSAGSDRVVRLWDVDSARLLGRWQGHTDRVRAAAVSPDGKLAATGGDDRAVRLWDVETGRAVRAITGHDAAVTAVAFAGAGRVVSASLDGSLRLWDVELGKGLRVLHGHRGGVQAVAVSDDAGRILSGGSDRTVRLWDVDDGEQRHLLQGHANAVVAVAFARGGRDLVSASSRFRTPDDVVRVWDAATGKELYRVPDPGDVGIGCFAIGPRGAAVSGGPDGMLRPWRWKIK